MKVAFLQWVLKPSPEYRGLYTGSRNSGNAERLRIVAVILVMMFSILLIQHILSPGLEPSNHLYPLYLKIYVCFIVGSLAYVLSDRLVSRRSYSVLAQWLIVLLILGGATALAVLDYSSSGDVTALFLGLITVSVFFRCPLHWFSLSVLGVFILFILGIWLLGEKSIEYGISVPLALDGIISIAFSMALGHYEIRTFTLQKEVEAANVRLTAGMAEKERTARDLENALAERDALFLELQHRVKNSLGMISSLLSLEEQRLDEGRARDIFREAQNRIITIATIYERLYRSKELDSVDLDEYTSDIIEIFLGTSVTERNRIRISKVMMPLRVDLKRAIPLGLILNELLTNATKHAFPDGRNGTIRIELEVEGTQARLRIQDDGVGLPAGFSAAHSDSLGLKLIDILATQIKAELLPLPGPGFGLEIAFTI